MRCFYLIMDFLFKKDFNVTWKLRLVEAEFTIGDLKGFAALPIEMTP
jgi:hypothetical protein